MANGIVTRTGASPEPFDAGKLFNDFMNSSRTGVGTRDAKNIGSGQPPAAPPLFSGGENFFTRLMNSSKTGVGTKDARDLGSSGNPVSPTGGVMGGLPSDYKATEASAFASAARHRGEMADFRGGSEGNRYE